MPKDKLSKSQKNTLKKSNQTKKNSNKNRAKGCSKVKKGNKGTSACSNWKNNPRRRTKLSKGKRRDKSTDKESSSKVTYTVSDGTKTPPPEKEVTTSTTISQDGSGWSRNPRFL